MGPGILRYSLGEHHFIVEPLPREYQADHYRIEVIACERRLFF